MAASFCCAASSWRLLCGEGALGRCEGGGGAVLGRFEGRQLLEQLRPSRPQRVGGAGGSRPVGIEVMPMLRRAPQPTTIDRSFLSTPQWCPPFPVAEALK